MFFVADVHTHDKKITPTPPTKTLNVKFDKKNLPGMSFE